ncbi:MAG TPA: NAD-dependent epimerase/dehydratase family protein [Polyangiaceae bacterium]|jgi:nucleoside-diphosphate-sugar epimerase
MRALVTGATGFLGSHIVDACLAQGDTVAALARAASPRAYLTSLPAVEIRQGDLTDAASLDRATRGVDVVYHSAARVVDYGSREDFYDQNVRGTEVLLDAARNNGVRRFVFVSSPSVVGDGSHQLNIDETYPYPARFLNLYSETKAAAEKLVLATNGPDFVTCAIRPRAVWGPRDRRGYMPKIVAKLLHGKMRDFSGGARVLASLCYCENAARACVLAAASPNVGGKAYFVTDREVVDVWGFMNTLAETFGAPRMRKRASPRMVAAAVFVIEAAWTLPALSHRRAPPLSRYGLSLLTRSGTYDTSAARRDFGYEPPVPQADGLARLRSWVDSIGGVEEFVQQVSHG